jgi:DNA repair ATPase RecN
MLALLSIRNFALVEELHLEFAPGFNVLTGETGAGKSILIDALGAALGARVGGEAVRSGSARAVVEAVFTVSAAEEERFPAARTDGRRSLLLPPQRPPLPRRYPPPGGRRPH